VLGNWKCLVPISRRFVAGTESARTRDYPSSGLHAYVVLSDNPAVVDGRAPSTLRLSSTLPFLVRAVLLFERPVLTLSKRYEMNTMSPNGSNAWPASHFPEPQLPPPPAPSKTGSSAPRAFQKAYQACLHCRKRKVRCELFNDGGKTATSCVRCHRERRPCEFSSERKIRQNSHRRASTGTNSLGNTEGKCISKLSGLVCTSIAGTPPFTLQPTRRRTKDAGQPSPTN
jgi:Fungal Zn(2)-Cys(6) binuclear cluster domain